MKKLIRLIICNDSISFRSAVTKAKAELKGQKDALAANAKELASLNAQAEKIRKQKQDYELEIKKWNNETEKVLEHTIEPNL